MSHLEVNVNLSKDSTRETIVFLVPVYNTASHILKKTVTDLHKKVHKFATIVIINDGSSKRETIEALDELGELERTVIIHASKNVGKAKALLLGLEYIKRNLKDVKCVFILDDDVTIGLSNKFNSEEGKNTDMSDVIQHECNSLTEIIPVATFPARSQNLSSKLERLQDIEHLIATHVARLYLHHELFGKADVRIGALTEAGFIEGIWVNGSGSLWLVDELHKVLEHHSGEHDGDDLEMTLILRRHKKLIKFSDKIVLYPVLKSRIRDFMKQRIRWTRGAIRLMFSHPREVMLHIAYTSYTLAPIALYTDLISLFLRHYMNNKFLQGVMDIMGIFVLALMVISYLRVIRFFEEIARVRNGSSSREPLPFKSIAQYIKPGKALIVVFVGAFLSREQLLGMLDDVVPVGSLYVDLSVYIAFVLYSAYFTYKLVARYRLEICRVYVEDYCDISTRTNLFMRSVTYSIYMLFYIMTVMPIGYLYSILKGDLLRPLTNRDSQNSQ